VASQGSWPYGTDLITYEDATGESLSTELGAATMATRVSIREAAIAEELENNFEEFTDDQAGGSYGETMEGEISYYEARAASDWLGIS
jgi:hypothetical protein